MKTHLSLLYSIYEQGSFISAYRGKGGKAICHPRGADNVIVFWYVTNSQTDTSYRTEFTQELRNSYLLIALDMLGQWALEPSVCLRAPRV